MEKPENQILVIFGASGDLAKRKLIPALFQLYKENHLPDNFIILGVSRTDYSDSEFQSLMKDAIAEFNKETDNALINKFANHLAYQPVQTKDSADYVKVKNKIEHIKKENGLPDNVIFYLSTPPSLYSVIPENLAMHGLNSEKDGWKRLIIEKPFGASLETAKTLNESIRQNWSEEQVYRIDHYLGKETVQNLLVTRFGNGIFEPLWNSKYVDHVEITSAESIGVENRGGYYDGSGALKDMVQNHLLQLVGFIAMEPPSTINSDSIRNEVVKVFQSFRRLSEEDIKSNVIRGQYLSATIDGKKVNGYRDEEGVKAESKTETYTAIKFYIDNWRWGGVPFYIRTGKRLPTRVTEAVIHFKSTPHKLFSNAARGSDNNQLIIRIQPDEGILIKFGMKIPGAGFNVQNVNMDFHYSDLSSQKIPQAYERLLLDAMYGDSTLYARDDEVLAAWDFLQPLINAWENDNTIPVYGYPAGTWGPDVADQLIEGELKTWRYPCKNLSNDGIYCEL